MHRGRSITRQRLRGEYIECTCNSSENFELFNCATFEARETTALRTVRDFVLCSWRRHECARAIASRYFLHEQLVAWISRRLQLWFSTRGDATVSGLRRRLLTFRRVADTVYDTIATITTRHDWTTRNRNEKSSCLPDWREMRRKLGYSIGSRKVRLGGLRADASDCDSGTGATLDCDGRGPALDSADATSAGILTLR